MSLRTLLRPDITHYLVLYDSDQTLQIRTRGFIKHTGEIEIGSSYQVKHGNRSTDIAQAKVLGAGTESQMTDLLEEKEADLETDSQPPKKKQKTTKTTKLVQKKKASVISRSSMPQTTIIQEVPSSPPTPPPQPIQETPHSPQTPTQPENNTVPIRPTPIYNAAPVDTPRPNPPYPLTSTFQPMFPAPSEPVPYSCPPYPVTEPVQIRPPPLAIASLRNPSLPPAPYSPAFTFPDLSSPLPITPDKRPVDRNNEQLNLRISALEAGQQEIKHNQQQILNMLSQILAKMNQQGTPPQTTTPYQYNPASLTQDTYPFLDVPEHLRFSQSDLNMIVKHSNCPGHFATKLLERLFPELFTTDNLRFRYSYYGGGKCDKRELSADRKAVLQRYVLHYYPHLSDSRIWKDAIVPRINEYLRRPVYKQQ